MTNIIPIPMFPHGQQRVIQSKKDTTSNEKLAKLQAFVNKKLDAYVRSGDLRYPLSQKP